MHASKKMPKLEPATSGGSGVSGNANLPVKIDEGSEPPHSDVLPT
jgi:hypothetical protein